MASKVEGGKLSWVASAWRNLAVGTSWRARLICMALRSMPVTV
jgi:hypothetical protein